MFESQVIQLAQKIVWIQLFTVHGDGQTLNEIDADLFGFFGYFLNRTGHLIHAIKWLSCWVFQHAGFVADMQQIFVAAPWLFLADRNWNAVLFGVLEWRLHGP